MEGSPAVFEGVSQPLTTAQLLSWISTVLLLQLAAGIAWTLWRHRRSQALRASVPASASITDAAWPGWRPFRVVRREYEDAAKTQCSFYLEPLDAKPLDAFKPGQFLTFSLDVPLAQAQAESGTRAITRCYSLSDRPQEAFYRVTIKRVPSPAEHPEYAPGLSSGHFHDRVQIGDLLRVKAPGGHFFLDPSTDLPVVLIAGGIGITPIVSMLRWCVEHQPQRKLHLYYGVRNSQEHAFKRELEQIAATSPALRLNVVYSRPTEVDQQGRDYQHHGYIDVPLLQRTLPHGRHQFYVCGPPAMMQTLVPALVEWGVSTSDLHYEAFGPASVRLPGAVQGATQSPDRPDVSFRRAGRTLIWDGTDASLLDFAERHGVAVESGCRSGSCGSCETRVVEGEVRYEQRPDHNIAPGHCLLCVGRPASALVLEA